MAQADFNSDICMLKIRGTRVSPKFQKNNHLKSFQTLHKDTKFHYNLCQNSNVHDG